MPEHIPYIRIFLSSPGDVNEECKIAIEVSEALPFRPAFRDKVAFRVIAWDRPGADTPMLASLTPQEAINRGLPKPSECDITLVLFWKRMGTPFVDIDGTAYESGTHWELIDALKNPQCETLIFHRTEKVLFDVDDTAGQDQYRRVKAFFSSEVFYKDGRILRGVNHYVTPEDFRLKMQTFMEDMVLRILDRIKKKPLTPEPTLPISTNIVTIQREDWPEGKSPFPGLRAFTADDAAIFFGRGYETDQLMRQVMSSRFVAVVGASGSGESSLVGAGLMPRLLANAISDEQTGSKDWRIVRFTPSKNPFESLFEALIAVFPQFKPNLLEVRRIKQNFVSDVRKAPETLINICEAGLEGSPAWAQVVLFVDQFEELFTLAAEEDAQVFSMMLSTLAKHPRMRAVVTMRHDFLNKAIENQILSEMLRGTSVFSLSIPRRDALREMIERPAERAGLTLEVGLVERILNDIGDEPGNLALMAYALDELYKIANERHDQRMTFDGYEALEGVQGAIGKRAEQTFQALTLASKETLLTHVFRELIEVDERGTAIRQRASQERFREQELELVRAFTNARLLVMDETQVEVAHEALFRSWERLKDWIAEAQEDLILLRQVRNAAHDWQSKGEKEYLLWPQERLTLVYAMQQRLKPDLNEVEQDFIEPEQTRLLQEIEKIETDPKRRRWIGERLATIGDLRSGIGLDERGVPQIDWLPVLQGGEIEIKGKTFSVPPFYVAKYLISYRQFQSFVDAQDGFENEAWWQNFPEKYVKQGMSAAVAQYDNYPRDSVSWYQSVAFGQWMNHKLWGLELAPPGVGTTKWVIGDNAEIRLPTEWEWQWMAQNGKEARQYPWGKWDRYTRANTSDAGIGERSTAVGMYMQGAAVCGALDVAGNLWEWCLNDYSDPDVINGFTNSEAKVLRGGSFLADQYYAAAAYRNHFNPNYRHNYYGLRLVAAPLGAL